MSLKVLLLLSLVAAASATPTPTVGLLTGLKDVLHIGTTDLGKSLGGLFETVNGVKNVAKNVISDILNLKVQVFADVVTVGVKIILGLADVVDASIAGLGNLIARIVGCTIKIVICFLGSKGDATICSNNWNTQFGVSASSAADIQALIRLYGLTDCYSRVQSIISVVTRGGGIATVNGSIRVVLQVAFDLASLINRVVSGSYNIVKADLTLIFRKIALILGAIGNSHKSGSGLQILNDLIPTWNKYFVSAGYPSFGNWNDIQVSINLGNGDNAPWALTDVDGSASTAVSVDTGIGALIGSVFKGVIGVTRLASNLIKDIVGLVIKTFDDVITLAVQIVLGLGGLLDSTIAGLGSLLVRIVAALLQIVLCFLGGSGKYGVCKSGWNRQFGINTDATSIETVISVYGLNNCKASVNKYISIYTNGNGISSVSGSRLILLQSTVTLAGYIDAGKFDRSILVNVFRQLAYLLGAIGNSNARGVGTKLCNKFIPTCNKYLAAEGYTGLGDTLEYVNSVIAKANDDDYIWSADIGGSSNKGSGFVVGTGVSGSTGVSGTIGGVIGGLLGGVFQVVRGVTKLAGNILTDIFSIKINAIADVFNLIVKLSLGIGGVIDSTVSGLGVLLTRIVAVILKIGICVNGFPGDRSICNKGWNAQFGVNGEASTQAELIVLFKLSNVQSDLDSYINKLTNNKGITSTSGSLRIILERCRTAAGYVSVSKQITKQSITDIFVILTTISAAIANSNKQNSGKEIVQQVIPKCGKYLMDQGYPDVTVQVNVVIKVILSANNDNTNWTTGGSTDTGNSGNTGSDSGNTGENSGNTGSDSGDTGGNSGSTGSDSGNTGGSSGSTGSNSGNTGGNSGSTGSDSGNTGGNSGNTGSDSGNTGGNSGNTGSDSGNTGGNSGNTGSDSGNTGGNSGSTGSDSGNTGGNSGNTGSDSGNTGGNSGNTGSDSGNTGGSSGNTGSDSGNTGGSSGNTGSDSGNTGGSSGNTGSDSGNTGGNSGNTGSDSGNTGGNSGNTESDSGNTGGSSGNTGSDSGNTGGSSGNTGSDSGNTGGSSGNTGSDSANTGGNSANTGGSTNGSTGGSVTIGGGASIDLGSIIGSVLKGLGGVTKLASNIITQIISIKINTFVDVLTLTFKVLLAIGGVIDTVVTGLGSILVRLVVVIFKVGICGNGFPGDKNVCTKDWNAQFGVTGDTSTTAKLIQSYNLQNCKSDIEKIISSYTSGKGIDSIKNGSIKLILKTVVNLGAVVSGITSSSTGSITKQDVSNAWSNLFIIVGVILNSNSKGSGNGLIQKIVPVCNKYFVSQGYPALITVEETVTIIIVGNDDNADWKTSQSSSNTGGSSGNTGAGTGGNSGSTGGNSGNTGGNSGNTGGSTSGNSGNTGNNSDNTGGSTGGNSESTGGNSGSTGGNSGNTGGNSGNTGGSTGGNSGSTGGNSDNTGGSTGGNSGSTGGNSDNTGGSTGGNSGSTGGNSGSTGGISGNTGGNSGNTGGSTGENSGSTGGNSGSTDGNSGNTGGNSGNTGGNTGGNSGSTGGNSDNTGGSTGGNSGSTGGNSDNTGGSTGGNSGSTGGNSGSTSGNSGNTGGSTGGSVTIGGGASLDLGSIIGGVLKGFTGVTKLVTNIVNQIISIKINAFVDVLNLAFKVSLGIGGIINSVIVGLGSILTRLIAVIFKIGICVNGFPGDKNICTKTWNAQFGIDGDASSAADLISLYRLKNCKSDINTIISVYTNGKGIDSIKSGSIKLILQTVVSLGTVVSGGSITKQDVSTSWSSLFIIVGAILNSNSKGSGNELTQKIVPACSQYFVNQGYPALTAAAQVVTTISVANDDNVSWKTGVVSGGTQTTVITQGDGLVDKVKDLFQNVKDNNNVQQTSVTAVLNLDIPNSFDDVIIFGIKVVRALGAILDLFIKGLGSFLTRIVAFLLRYIVCVLGVARNSKCYICQNTFYESFGLTVKGNAYADIAGAFNVSNAQAELDAILAAYTSKGRASLSGSVKICFDQAYALTAIVSKGTKIVESDLSSTLESITTLLGGFANSCSANLGNQICVNMVPVCSTFLQKNNYPALGSASITATIQAGNGDSAPWARSATVTTTTN